ncbi:MAG: tRNA-dihydrouridine synthase family protein, partial [Odoribacter sp.]|nr:tRNA-dihydrouridine synthase family protein [Odoribacter sp.]
VAENGYSAIDINLGCPFPLVAGKRKGAGMLPYPERVERMLATVNEYPEIRFSVKMRLGWESVSECILLSNILNALRLSHITIHARTGKQQYKGNTDLEAFAAFYKISSHPLFYNGDVHSREEIHWILQKFPMLMGVSIGRRMLSSPLMGKEFKENVTFSSKNRMSLYFSFHEALFSAYSERLQGEMQLLTKMKTLWEYFLPEVDRKLLKSVKKAQKLSQYTEAVRKILTV